MGLEAATEIARAESTFRLAFGSGDFRRDTGMSDDPLAMAYPVRASSSPHAQRAFRDRSTDRR